MCRAIDGSHISIKPAENHTDYYNRKGWYSIFVQAVVDHEYFFQDICVGWPGCVHDARVYGNSELYKKALDGKILKGEKKLINGTEVPIYLVADSAYPISDFIMKPFDFSSSMSQNIKIYNYRISCARIVVKNAFGRLKARWHRLQKQNDMFIENVSTIVASCCLLHNICQLHGDSFNSEWLND